MKEKDTKAMIEGIMATLPKKEACKIPQLRHVLCWYCGKTFIQICNDELVWEGSCDCRDGK